MHLFYIFKFYNIATAFFLHRKVYSFFLLIFVFKSIFYIYVCFIVSICYLKCQVINRFRAIHLETGLPT
ncbi:hypothetical protein C1646_187877 [Rhizophagus diaphanus]|nr:hypothetical protein C1646_187877 [Rhizophagus diaphanus] [Rhizophagus sp. MUCL 43196]